MITAGIHACSVVNFGCHWADRHMNNTIYAMHQRTRVDSLTICNWKTNWHQFFMRLSCYWQRIWSLYCQSSLWIHKAKAELTHSYFDNGTTKFMINNRTDTWKININLLNLSWEWLNVWLFVTSQGNTFHHGLEKIQKKYSFSSLQGENISVQARLVAHSERKGCSVSFSS